MLPYPFCDSQFAYQPIINIATGEAVAYEALTRFDDLSLRDTQDAVTRIEELGLIEYFDQGNVMRARKVLMNPASLHGRRLMLNLSAESMSSRHFVSWLKRAIVGVPNTHLLGVEITETMPISNPLIVQEAIAFLMQCNIYTHLDDVGSGYMSHEGISRLSGYRGLKIDGHIIDDWDKRQDADNFIQQIMGVSRDQGVTVTAEHLDNPDKILRAQSYGIHFAQGFDLGVPRKSPENPSLIKARYSALMSRVVLAPYPAYAFD